uniref:Interphotoreceptor matrix proteoglycan 2 n=1 Tax=Oncorhynchus kisutch TaxID=8019 RepID=A0A8C7J3R6_ONCKI
MELLSNAFYRFITDAASGEGPLLPDGQDLYYKTVRISPILSVPQSIVHSPLLKVSHKDHGAILRQKRNVLFPSGVKLCAEEGVQQSIANHLSYFHLRVCQETVWEAFKIFWDRLPNQEEYQTWMSQCLDGTATALAMGKNFSQSKEFSSRMVLYLAPSIFPSILTIFPVPAEEKQAQTMMLPPPCLTVIIEGAEVELPTEPTNDIEMEVLEWPTRAQLEQVVELSILLKGERYSDALRDTASFQYQTLNQQFIDKVRLRNVYALGGLPGLKSVTVLEFRLDGVVVVYAVTVEVEGEGVSSEQLDYLTLQSNLVENSYRELKERPTVVYNITDFRNNITEALLNDNIIRDTTLALDPDLLQLESGKTHRTTQHCRAIHCLYTTIHSKMTMEEGLLLGNTVATESPPPELLPADPVSPEQPEGSTLPKPPLEIEPSGSGVDRLEDLPFLPEEEEEPASAAEEEHTIEEEVVLEEVIIEEEILTEEAESKVPEEVQVQEEAVEVPEEEEEVVEVPEEEEVKEEAVEVPEEEEEEEEAVEVPEEVVVEEEVVEIPEEEVVEEEAVEVPEEEEEAVEVPEEEEEAVEVSEEEEVEEEVVEVPEEEVVEEEAVEVPEEEEEAVEVPEEEEVEEEAVDVPEEEEEAVEVPEEEEEAVEVPEEEEEEEEAVEVPEEVVVEEEVVEVPAAPEPEAEAEVQGVTPALTPAKYFPGPDISITLEVIKDDGEMMVTIDPVTDYDLVPFGGTNQTEEGSSGYPSGGVHGVDHSVAMPINPGRALMVFFSLRVTNMKFSDDLFNKSSPEYKALEQRFIELLLPYLQSNLSNFQNLEILNFRNGSIVVNSRMKFGKPVPRGVNNAVYLILEDFANTAYKTMNLAIDKYSLDVESGDQANQCKFQACNEFAQCSVNRWSGEAECVCNAGYFSVDGLPCQSICDLQTDFCMNDGKCDIIPGQGAICRCRVGENWWYRGEHCEEYVSEPLVVGIAIASVAGFLLVASGVIFFLARTLRDQYDKDETEDPLRRGESIPSLERATKYNPMYESEATTGYSHYYRRYPEAPVYSSASAEASTDFSSEEIRHIYENSELTKEEIQDRIRIIELYAKDRQFADFVRQHQT